MASTGLRTILVATAAIPSLLAAGDARAANGAYAVDAADISEVGSCKVESWISAATNTDFSAVANPSCVVNIFRPVELSLLTNRFRSDGDWSTNIVPKAKTNLVPTGIGKFGVSFYAAGSFDALTGENLALLAVVPATYRLSETMRAAGCGTAPSIDITCSMALASTGSSPMSCSGRSRDSVRPARPMFRAWSGPGF